jgi:Helix-turn-helix domain
MQQPREKTELSLREAAEFLGITPETVRNHIVMGRLRAWNKNPKPACWTSTRVFRIPLHSLRLFKMNRERSLSGTGPQEVAGPSNVSPMENPGPDQPEITVLTVPEAAAFLNVTPANIRAYIRNRELRAWTKTGYRLSPQCQKNFRGSYRIPYLAILEFKAKREIPLPVTRRRRRDGHLDFI